MKTGTGIWIDHKKAYIVRVTPSEHNVICLKSDIPRSHKATGGKKGALPYVFNGGGAARKQERHLEKFVHEFFKNVAKQMGAKDQHILIFGPSSAKKELKDLFLKSKTMAPRIQAVQSAEPMTERQMAAKVRTYFRLKAEAV